MRDAAGSRAEQGRVTGSSYQNMCSNVPWISIRQQATAGGESLFGLYLIEHVMMGKLVQPVVKLSQVRVESGFVMRFDQDEAQTVASESK